METNQNSGAESSRPESGPHNALQPQPPSEQAEPPPFRPDFALVPVRYRHDGWTPERQRLYVEELADALSPAIAAARIGMTEQSVNRLRRRRGAEGFCAASDAALLHGLRHKARSLAIDRALNGTLVRRFYHGQLVAEERVYSDRLLLFLLEKGEKLFGAGGESRRMLEDWDGWMDKLESGALEGGWRVWRDRNGIRMTNYPPPPAFDGYSESEPGEPDYCRRLTEAEEDAIDSSGQARIGEGEAARDLFFGFKPGRRRIDRESRSR